MFLNSSKRIRGLYSICDNSFSPQYSHLELARLMLKGGARVLQLRMKGEKDKDLVRKIATSILEEKQNYSFTFILNDEVELAALLPVDGVHVGIKDLSISDTRRKVGNKKLIGYSSHSIAEALEAECLGADYVALGAIFPTKTKGPGHPVQGLAVLEELVSRVKIPVVAIGGISKENFDQVLKTNVSAVAMITALTQAEDITAATRWFVERFQE